MKDPENLICKVLVGSRAYGTDVEGSDRDYMGVFVTPIDQLIDNPISTIRTKDGSYFEVGKYGKMLERGDLHATELLFNDFPNFIYKSHLFEKFEHIRSHLLSKETLEQWLNTSSVFYSKALRLGSLFKDKISPVDYMTYYPHNQAGLPNKEAFSSCMERGSLTREVIPHKKELEVDRMCLYPLSYGVYLLFRDYNYLVKYNGDDFITGMFDKDGELVENGIKNPDKMWSLVNEGVIIFEKKKYLKYKNLKKTYGESKIVNGYATKSMLHAFRILELIGDALIDSTLHLKVKAPGHYLAIREGKIPRDEIKNAYEGQFNTVKQNLENYKKILVTDISLIQETLSKIRKFNRPPFVETWPH